MSAAPPATAFVLDCSVALGAFFADEQDAYTLAVWQSLPDAQAQVPPLWHLEMGDVLGRALRAGRIGDDDLQQAWRRLDQLGLRTLEASGDGRFWARRAADWGLSAFDACYLDSALQHRLPLATRDKTLADAARRLGVPLYLNTPARGPR